MSGKLNCWEILECGMQPGGANTEEYGICPAASDKSMDGINVRKNGGRICWAVAGTLCKGEVHGIFACKIESCFNCAVFELISNDEEEQFKLMPPDGDLK